MISGLGRAAARPTSTGIMAPLISLDRAALVAAGTRPEGMRDDEAALHDLATSLYRDRKVSDSVYQAALAQFGERGIMDIIGTIGFYDITSITLITMQAGVPDGKPLPLPILTK